MNDKDTFLETVTVKQPKPKKKYYKRIPKELQKKRGTKKGTSKKANSWWDTLKSGDHYYTDHEPKYVTAFAVHKKVKVKTEVCLLVRPASMEVLKITRVEIVSKELG